MLCPRCGSDNVRSLSRGGWTRPKLVGRAIVRHHRCGECSMRFRSYQIAVTNHVEADAVIEAMTA